MSRFLTELDAKLKPCSDSIWIIETPLIYESDLVGLIVVPKCFETDFASVPRIPIAYMAFGDRAHREAVLHDYLYRIDSEPQVTFMQANKVFLEAMELRGKGFFTRWAMYMGVVAGGIFSFHKKKVNDQI
jgi:hypothetical protein